MKVVNNGIKLVSGDHSQKYILHDARRVVEFP